MRYKCELLPNNKVIIELIPILDSDKELIKILDPTNSDYDDTLHYHYSKGLRLCNASALLMKIDKFINVPNIAICSYQLDIV